MINLFFIFIAIIILFFIFLIAKSLLKRKFCVICISISLTWLTLLIFYFTNHFDNIMILGLLMGQSIVGIYYLVEKKTKEELHIFRLPFLLTLTFIFYLFLSIPKDILAISILLSALWVAFFLMFTYRKNKTVKSFVKKIIACCKDW